MARMWANRTAGVLEPELPVQAAAVCYRLNSFSVEFLLVRTSSGKWTFPKGRLNPSMTAAESAAQEAWEEAGAKGRIAEKHFSSYIDTKRGLRHDSGTHEVRIFAYLFEVHTTVAPQETGRDPQWFSPEDAKKQLAGGRSSRYARQLANVIEFAVESLAARNGRMLPLLVRAHGRGAGPAR